MKSLYHLDSSVSRVPIPKIIGGGNGDERNGCFTVWRNNVELRIIASNGGGWDHVSVHAADGGSNNMRRIPTWDEMEFVKRLFFKPNEVAMQLHVKPDDHINVNQFTLHLWRPHHQKIPLPPKEFV